MAGAPSVTTPPHPLRRERALILASLVVLAAGSWLLLIRQANALGGRMDLTMGMDAALFLAVWVVMMVAMMFPSAAPMILVFARVSGANRQQGRGYVPIWVFVSAYLVVWTLFGLLLYGAAVAAQSLAVDHGWLMDDAPRIGGAVLVLAGIYQLMPLKRACLTKCRTPIAFVMTSWRSGYRGAFRMGLEHGLYCLGCCWLLFVILFPLGVMNIAIMALLTLLIFGEKTIPGGYRLAQAAAVGLVAYGLLVIAVPSALPGMTM